MSKSVPPHDDRAPRFRGAFSFFDWAQAERFEYPARGAPMLERVGSPAEAYFIRRLFQTSATVYADGEKAYCRGVTVRVQVPCDRYIIDATAERERCRLAIEIDGFAFHNATRQQVAADYFRARRILCAGYIVVRFTAAEVMSDPTAAWRDVFSVLSAQRAAPRSA